jgi:hypothetical protein
MTVASAGASAAMLDGFEDFMESGAGTATATLYQTNTSLCVFNLAAAPFGAGNGRSLVLASAPISSTGTEVAGKANRLVLRNQDEAEALSCTVGGDGSGADIETPSLTVTAAVTQTLNSLVLRMAPDGALTAEASLTLA